MTFAPEPYDLAPEALSGSFGLALASGRLLATVVSKKSGKHITINLRAKRREGKRFRACDLAEAERIYIDTPKADNVVGSVTEVGVLHLSGKWAGKILPPWQQDFDAARVWSARRILDVAHGRAPISDAQAEILEGKVCLMCGRELTDPESIARNIGPECWRRISGLGAASGEHQVPGAEQTTFAMPTEAEVIARDTRNAEEEHAEAHMGRYPGDEFFDQVGRDDEEEGNAEDGAMGYPVPEDQTREQIEAELKQTALPSEAGEGTDPLPAEPPVVAEGMVLLRAGDDPRTLLAESEA